MKYKVLIDGQEVLDARYNDKETIIEALFEMFSGEIWEDLAYLEEDNKTTVLGTPIEIREAK